MKLKHICALILGGYVLLAMKCGGGINDPVTVTLPPPAEVAETIGSAAVQTVELLKNVSDQMQEAQTDPIAAQQGICYSASGLPGEHIYRIRSAWDNPLTQIGAYYDPEYAKRVCPEGYYVFDENGNVVS